MEKFALDTNKLETHYWILTLNVCNWKCKNGVFWV